MAIRKISDATTHPPAGGPVARSREHQLGYDQEDKDARVLSAVGETQVCKDHAGAAGPPDRHHRGRPPEGQSEYEPL